MRNSTTGKHSKLFRKLIRSKWCKRKRNANRSSEISDEASASKHQSPRTAFSEKEPTRALPNDELESIKDIQEAINHTHPFGIKLWKPALYQKSQSLGGEVQGNTGNTHANLNNNIGNWIWAVLLGSWLAFLYILVGSILFLCGKAFKKLRGLKDYGKILIGMSIFLFWPFGNHLVSVLPSSYRGFVPHEKRIPFTIYKVAFLILLAPAHLIVSCIAWLTVSFIPMSIFSIQVMQFLFQVPLHIRAIPKSDLHSSSPTIPLFDVVKERTLIYIERATRMNLFKKLAIKGINIVIFNLLLFFVPLSFLLEYVFHCSNPVVLFGSATLSVIPMVYIIGMAVSSITVTTGVAVGAVLNAFFSGACEVLLYLIAIGQGKSKLVLASIIGSILVGLLLLPGLSFLFGGLRYPVQMFNSRSASITRTLLIMGFFGCFVPTLVKFFGQSQRETTPIDTTPIVVFCSILLPTIYSFGLLFTLKTHKTWVYSNKKQTSTADSEYVFEDREPDPAHCPNWNTKSSVIILLLSTIAFSFISEILLRNADAVFEGSDTSFLGLTIFSIVPSISELYNGVLFAMDGSLSVTLEMGSQYVVQVLSIQVPLVVLGNYILKTWFGVQSDFSLVSFSLFDVFVVSSTIMLSSIVFSEGRSNYFKGLNLLFTYSLFLVCYFFMST